MLISLDDDQITTLLRKSCEQRVLKNTPDLASLIKIVRAIAAPDSDDCEAMEEVDVEQEKKEESETEDEEEDSENSWSADDQPPNKEFVTLYLAHTCCRIRTFPNDCFARQVVEI